jgi:hypothetical protein
MSNRWTSVFAWVASMAAVWAIVVPRGLSLTGLVWMSVLGLVVLVTPALLASMASNRSMGQILSEVQAEPITAGAAIPVRARISKLR